MEAGEKELRKAFEEVSNKNIRATITHSNETRKLLRAAEERIKLLEEKILQIYERFDVVQKQIVQLQMKSYSRG